VDDGRVEIGLFRRLAARFRAKNAGCLFIERFVLISISLCSVTETVLPLERAGDATSGSPDEATEKYQ